jgi:uncharacterized protein YfaS (alpha-2-macroglobulin family)
VIDLAALALADPNSRYPAGILWEQPLASNEPAMAAMATGTSFDGGIGGGGKPAVGSCGVDEFPDTAYRNAELTDANGEAEVTISLPDSLTTWQVDARGLTADTRVGQSSTQVITTKEVLIRPVTPRFLVAGDHTELAAVVQNNTMTELKAQVSLQALGFVLDDDQPAEVELSLPAGGRSRLAWWGTAQDAPYADLIFTVEAGDYQDAARPALGALPVVRYTARQAFATSGYLEGAVQQLELVSLPPAALTSDLPGGGAGCAFRRPPCSRHADRFGRLEYYRMTRPNKPGRLRTCSCQALQAQYRCA